MATDLRCSFCGRDGARCIRLFRGPGVNICGECLDLCEEVRRGAAERPEVRAILIARGLCCSFCERGRDQVARLVAGAGTYICDQCIDAVSEILVPAPSPFH